MLFCLGTSAADLYNIKLLAMIYPLSVISGLECKIAMLSRHSILYIIMIFHV